MILVGIVVIYGAALAGMWAFERLEEGHAPFAEWLMAIGAGLFLWVLAYQAWQLGWYGWLRELVG